MSKKKRKAKRGLTDKLFIAVAVFTVTAFIYSAVLMWVTKDTSGLAYFLPASAGFGTIVMTAIIDKNKKENINKHAIAERAEEDNR